MGCKGIILAGGLGKRMEMLTRVTNKHLLTVYDRPMVFYPLKTLVDSGIKDIMVVTGGQHAGKFLNLLKNGEDFGLSSLHYAYQEGEGGIADALRLAESFAGGDSVAVILGDNIFQNSFKRDIDRFEKSNYKANVFVSRSDYPQRFGVIKWDEAQLAETILEKPETPPSNDVVTGFYLYRPEVFEVIKTLQPSARGELEITDVNNHFLHRGETEVTGVVGWWTDCGTPQSLFRANQLVREDNR